MITHAVKSGIVRTESPAAPVIVGVVNVTPDSFSDGGAYFDPAAAISHAAELAAAGARIIDIGGESTRPGSSPLDAETEWLRIEPVIAACAAKFHVSVDTQKSTVAERALQLGAKAINDVSALRFDPRLAAVVSRFDADLVLMFSAFAEFRPPPNAPVRQYGDVIAEIAAFFRNRIAAAISAGIDPSRIIVDPGLGAFVSKDPGYSWEIIAKLGQLRELGVSMPVMIGTSRKGFLGGAIASRDPISQLAALAAVRNGAKYVRTHNPAMARDLFAATL